MGVAMIKWANMLYLSEDIKLKKKLKLIKTIDNVLIFEYTRLQLNKKKDFDGESKIVLKVPAIRCGCETETSKNYPKITPELQAEKQFVN